MPISSAPSASSASWAVAPEPVGSAAAVALWRAYYTEVSDRWYELREGRRTDGAELERGIAADTGAELSPPAGVLLLARHDGEPAGTAGVHLLAPGTAELTRVFILPGLRGKGGGAVLLTAAEEAARALGATRVLLDTRHDLVEARALYVRHGYVEGPPHNTGTYAERWYRKDLTPRTA
ncbi:GNAT family N-acetyltransferase [Streptomyces aureocirculatus]|uniref:GNAT family N-acetyltransferase n=1 Tax=Streptomyces aureocirculatus TaxID=67275 RepID=UPI00068AD4C6|nr:GNAT family N-acetyltransferase [Streptomyces aureocirculatus]